MQLSRVEIDREFLKNPYKVHKSLWTLFPDESASAARPFLYRVEWKLSSGRVRALMQSLAAPDSRAARGCRLLETKEIAPAPQEGQLLRFVLCANPTKRLAKERSRVPFVREEEQLGWLDRRLEPAGRALERHVLEIKELRFRKGRTSGRVYTVTFGGVLRVDDPVRLKGMVRDGIGPAKSFGCGLLSLARS